MSSRLCDDFCKINSIHSQVVYLCNCIQSRTVCIKACMLEWNGISIWMYSWCIICTNTQYIKHTVHLQKGTQSYCKLHSEPSSLNCSEVAHCMPLSNVNSVSASFNTSLNVCNAYIDKLKLFTSSTEMLTRI